MKDLNLVFISTIVKEGSFSKAADVLGVTQPAVSKRVAVIESELGVSLFDRKGGSINLTKEGKVVLKYANEILAIYEDMRLELDVISDIHKGELVIGASTTIAQYVLPPMLAEFGQLNPNVEIVLLSGNSSEVEKWIKEGKVRLGFVEGNYQSPSLTYEPILKDELVAIVSKHSTCSRLDNVPLADLMNMPLVLREEGSGTLEVFKEFVESKGLGFQDFNVLMQLGSTESIKLFLKKSEALGVVSVRAVSKDLMQGEFKLVDIEEGQMSRWFSLVFQSKPLDKVSASFMLFCNSYITKSYT